MTEYERARLAEILFHMQDILQGLVGCCYPLSEVDKNSCMQLWEKINEFGGKEKSQD